MSSCCPRTCKGHPCNLKAQSSVKRIFYHGLHTQGKHTWKPKNQMNSMDCWILDLFYIKALFSTTNENLRNMFFPFISGNFISRFHADVQKWQVSSLKLLTPATHRRCLRTDSCFWIKVTLALFWKSFHMNVSQKLILQCSNSKKFPVVHGVFVNDFSSPPAASLGRNPRRFGLPPWFSLGHLGRD